MWKCYDLLIYLIFDLFWISYRSTSLQLDLKVGWSGLRISSHSSFFISLLSLWYVCYSLPRQVLVSCCPIEMSHTCTIRILVAIEILKRKRWNYFNNVYYLANIHKILFQYATHFKIEIFYILFCTKSYNSRVCFIFRAHLNLYTVFSLEILHLYLTLLYLLSLS